MYCSDGFPDWWSGKIEINVSRKQPHEISIQSSPKCEYTFALIGGHRLQKKKKKKTRPPTT